MIGCEIWRDLDWLKDSDKEVLPVDRFKNLAAALSGVFDSQIRGGKRYDAAVAGRRMSHATFFESHATDKADALAVAHQCHHIKPIAQRQAHALDGQQRALCAVAVFQQRRIGQHPLSGHQRAHR